MAGAEDAAGVPAQAIPLPPQMATAPLRTVRIHPDPVPNQTPARIHEEAVEGAQTADVIEKAAADVIEKATADEIEKGDADAGAAGTAKADLPIPLRRFSSRPLTSWPILNSSRRKTAPRWRSMSSRTSCT